MINEFQIETERFLIFPLMESELKNYINNPSELSSNLNITLSTIGPDAETKDAINRVLLPNINNNNETYIFSTIWLIIDKKWRNQVGGFCFHARPDEHGEAEIGYGTEPEFQNKGIMTESLQGIIKWIKETGCVKSLIAKTNNDNIPSWKVLEKNNFLKISENDNLITWIYYLNGEK